MSFLKRLPSPGTYFAGHFLEAEVGRGGAGAVYRARTPEGRVLALKVLMRDLSEERQRVRFEREAIAGQELRHPGVVAVYGSGVEQGLGYMTMELLEEALPLDAYVTQHQTPLPQRLRLFGQICEAVQAAHDAGLIHRDLKPDNVLVTREGRAKVVDFGLARHLDRERLTQSGATMGTLFYMAPEQIRGNTAHADARADVYALGVILYQLVSGLLPFTGESAMEIMRRTLEEEPPPLEPQHAAYEPVIRLALAKEPEQRYPTVRDFARDLIASESDLGTAASGLLAAQRLRRAAAIGGLGLGTCALLGGAALYYSFGAPARDPRLLTEARLLELCASAAPLASASEAIATLEAPPDAPELAREVARLRALLNLARGRPAEASAGQTPLGWAWAGASAGQAGAADLTRALRGGLEWAELYRWRALAAGEAAQLSRSAARQVLSDAGRWREAAGPPRLPLDERLLAAEARAFVATGQLGEARRVMRELRAVPRALSWEFALALVGPALPTRPLDAQAALLPLAPGPPPPALEEAAQAAGARALVALTRLVRDGISRKNQDQAVALLEVQRRLDPAGEITPALRRELLAACNGLRAPILLELAVLLGESFPEDAHVQRELALVARRLDKGEQRFLFPVLRRSIQLDPSPAGRFDQELAFAYLLAHTSEPTPAEVAEFEELLERLLPRLEDPALRAVLISARGRLSMVRGAPDLARRDLRAAVEYDPSFALPYHLLMKLERRAGRHEQALGHALDYMKRKEQNNGRREETLVYAWEQRQQPLALTILRVYLEEDPGHGGWWIRLALLEARAGASERAQAAALEGAGLLRDAADSALEAIGAAARRAAERADPAERLAGLEAAVKRLEALRHTAPFP